MCEVVMTLTFRAPTHDGDDHQVHAACAQQSQGHRLSTSSAKLLIYQDDAFIVIYVP